MRIPTIPITAAKNRAGSSGLHFACDHIYEILQSPAAYPLRIEPLLL
jgi:hypothetical protein